MSRILPHRPHPRKFNWGNRCGFDLAKPRCYTDGAGFAKLEFLARLQDAIWNLCTRDPFKWAGRRRIHHKERGILHDRPIPNAIRMEAIRIVLQFMAVNCQVKDNLRILYYPKFKGVPIDDIIDATGLSYSRVKWAIADLTSVGFLHSYQPREETAAGWRGRPAIRRFTFKLLKAIGMMGSYKHFRKTEGMKPPREPIETSPALAYVERARARRIHRLNC